MIVLDIVPVAASSLFTGAAIWLGMLGLLVALTRGISKGLAWVFLATGIAIPVLLVYHCTDVAAASGCTDENVVNQGLSADARYRYAIVERNCGTAASTEFQVKIGKRDELGLLHTVFVSNGARKPAAVQQHSDHEFMVVMAPVERISASTGSHPVMVRMDPLTGQAEDTFDFRQGEVRS